MESKSKKGQIAIFVVIAIVIVAGLIGYFLLKDRGFGVSVPAEFTPIYDYYTSCIQAKVVDGASLLGTQAGHIDLPEFEFGSEYAPFSNQLDFMGFGVPYWYYVTNNGLIKEQIPTKQQMESQFGDYLEDKVEECDFTEFRRQGYDISVGEARVSVDIQDNRIVANVKQSLSIERVDESGEGQKVVVGNHKIEVDSMLGEYYDIAKGIYDYEKQEMFLETYAIDALYSYAPVTGAEISCSPLFWNPYEVIDEVKAGLEANIGVLKVKGDYYDLDSGNKGYHVVDPGFSLSSEEQINFLYSGDWASRFEVWPTKGDLMIAKPVGPQQGLAAAGFCYVSYKFVYDLYFPVMVQVHNPDNAEDIFQFPMAVVVSKNQPREALAVSSLVEDDENVCDNANTEISIYIYNTNLEPVEADLEFKCFTDVCDLGKTVISTTEAKLDVEVPQCVNGIIVANAEGYREKEYSISTNSESVADIILDKEQLLELEIFVDNRLTQDISVLTISEVLESGESEILTTVGYPYVTELDLSEGDYNFNLMVYTEKSITLPEDSRTECVEVPKSGLLGFFGAKDEECFDYTIPSQEITSVMNAGGSQNQYVTQSELAGATKIRIYADSIAVPSKLEDIQKTYELIAVKNLRIEII